jgi:acyl-CoA dehydrogenase
MIDSVPDFVGPLREFLSQQAPRERVHRDDEDQHPPTDLLQKLGSLGYLSIGLPASWGGGGTTILDAIHLMLELGRAHLALGHLVGRVIYAQQLMLHSGTKDQQEEWIPRLVSGEVVFCVSITEPDAGSDAASITTRAVKEGDSYVINGQKLYSSSMGYADLAMVLTRTSKQERKQDGLTTFLIDPKSSAVLARRLNTLGDWAAGTYEVFLTDLRVPETAILGELDHGWAVINGHLTRERLIMAARAIGATSAVLQEAAQYAVNRKQFGRPIADFQVIRHRIADGYIRMLNCRAGLFDVARRSETGEDVRMDAAAVKVAASEMYVDIANIAMQMTGGYGFTREAGIERHLRDARIYVVGGGSSEVMRDYIARELLRNGVHLDR